MRSCSIDKTKRLLQIWWNISMFQSVTSIRRLSFACQNIEIHEYETKRYEKFVTFFSVLSCFFILRELYFGCSCPLLYCLTSILNFYPFFKHWLTFGENFIKPDSYWVLPFRGSQPNNLFQSLLSIFCSYMDVHVRN